MQQQESYDYNNLLQPVRIQLGSSTTANANSCVVYNYYFSVSNPTSCAIPTQATAGNNGNVKGQFFQDSTNPSPGHTATYTYDFMNRLATSVAIASQPDGAAHNLRFSYDRYGNMAYTQNAQTNGPARSGRTTPQATESTTPISLYDAAGNLTRDGRGAGTHTYQLVGRRRRLAVCEMRSGGRKHHPALSPGVS